MKDTEILEIDPNDIDNNLISKCGRILREGGIVAFPTETVYGLGADALNPKAIKKVFAAKGRPSDNPLIIHVSRVEDIEPLVEEIPEKAYKAMAEFWPGPLTIILKKTQLVPREISGGLATVAIRMPSHPIALKLIEAAGLPIAAPSANTSGRPSPTKADHVIEDLKGKVDAIISGGDSRVGIESTVLDMTGDIPLILRPGGITREMLEKVLGEVAIDPAVEGPTSGKTKPKSPGMKYTHYSPRAEMVVVEGEPDSVVSKIKQLKSQYEKENKKVGIICTDETLVNYDKGIIKSLGSRRQLNIIAANLFKVLREFDKTDVEIILCESVDSIDLGQAIMNRLSKAAGYHIYKA